MTTFCIKIDAVVKKREEVCESRCESSQAASFVHSHEKSETRSKPPVKQAWGVNDKAAKVESVFESNSEHRYCIYCGVTCNSESQFNIHCSSAKHKLSVNSDKDREWTFRPPPIGLPASEYRLCEKYYFDYFHRFSFIIITAVVINASASDILRNVDHRISLNISDDIMSIEKLFSVRLFQFCYQRQCSWAQRPEHT
jgi:hypothetical protein